jgi:phosphoglycolate phosphatase-like HAD superfamily hydrolase
MPRAVIFDVDGTLVDSVDRHAQAWVETFAEFGYECDFAAVRYQIGKGGDQLMKEFLTAQQIQRDGEAIEKARQRHFRTRYLPGVLGFPMVRELFLRLIGEGKKVVLASSAVGEELAAYKRKAAIGDLVEEETSKDDVEKSKPHPDIFEAALAKLGDISASEALIVGDSPWDAIAGRQAGLRTIGLLCGGFGATELERAGCAAIYRDPADLLKRYNSSLLCETGM